MGGKPDDITVVAAVVVDTGLGGASVNAARDGAAAALRPADKGGVLSACGDHLAERRPMFLGTTDADDADELAARLAAKAAAKKAAQAEADATFVAAYTEAQAAAMDAAQCRKVLGDAGLPTSGKIDALRVRVLTIPAPPAP